MKDQPHAENKYRPRDFAMLLLAAGPLLPRQRARDQQADREGLQLKQQLLCALRDADPDASELTKCFEGIIGTFGDHTGPARALALSLYEDWKLFCQTPAWAAHLLDEAIQPTCNESTRRGRQLPG